MNIPDFKPIGAEAEDDTSSESLFPSAGTDASRLRCPDGWVELRGRRADGAPGPGCLTARSGSQDPTCQDGQNSRLESGNLHFQTPSK